MLRLFVLLLFVLASSGCVGPSAAPLAWQDDAVDLVWPAEPDRARVRYLRSLSGPEDFRSKDRASGVLSWFLGKPQAEPGLVSPYAVASSQSGVVWVADNVSHLLYRFDVARRKINYFQEFSGLTLISPSGVAVDDERKRVFLADAAHQRVFVLDNKGAYLASWAPPGGFKRPAGMTLDSAGRLLVADAAAGVVFIFNPDGTLASQVHSKMNPSGFFARPLNVAVGPMGEILVLDAFSFRVEVLDAQGALLGTIGELGDAAGYMARPKGLAVNQAGHVFVSDSAFDNIQVFDMTGNLLMFWGNAGGGPGEFNLPAGLFIDPEGRLLVADSYNHRVQAFQLLP
jgi:DNA-binding beta-propeller fold protein YncE